MLKMELKQKIGGMQEQKEKVENKRGIKISQQTIKYYVIASILMKILVFFVLGESLLNFTMFKTPVSNLGYVQTDIEFHSKNGTHYFESIEVIH